MQNVIKLLAVTALALTISVPVWAEQTFVTIGTGGVTGGLLSIRRSDLPSGQQETQGTRHPLFHRKHRRFRLQHQHNSCW